MKDTAFSSSTFQLHETSADQAQINQLGKASRSGATDRVQTPLADEHLTDTHVESKAGYASRTDKGLKVEGGGKSEVYDGYL